MIDEGFIRRTYRTSAVVWAFTLLVLLSFRLWLAAVGFTVGALLSFGILASLNYVVRRTFVPGAVTARKNLMKVGILKLIVIIGVVVGVVLTRRVELILGFCGGVGLTQLVMFLKALGLTLTERTGK